MSQAHAYQPILEAEYQVRETDGERRQWQLVRPIGINCRD